MFLHHFNLREQPFGMTPDPRFLWSSASHREAFASLVYGIETGRGFVALIAKPGMGKTTLLFHLMEKLRNSARTVFLFQSQSNSREFFSNLVADLGLDPAENDMSRLQRQLNDVLVEESRMGRRFVLIVDEAQNLADSVLESVRMLSNFETPQAKLMQIVLSGQPQLADKLMRPELAQLRQRVSVIANLNPLNRDEVDYYIQYRLKAAGYPGGRLFAPEAVEVIAERSDGIPRNINNICFHGLSVAFARRQKLIDLPVMEEVLSDLNMSRLRSRRSTAARRPAVGEKERPESRVQSKIGKAAIGAGSVALRGIREAGSLAPIASTSRLGGRLFWAAALVTVLIWGGVFWDSSTARFQMDTIREVVSAVVWRTKVIAQNVRNGLSAAPQVSAPQPATGTQAPRPQPDSQPDEGHPQAPAQTGVVDLTNQSSALASVPDPSQQASEVGSDSESIPLAGSPVSAETGSAEKAQKPPERSAKDYSGTASNSRNGSVVVESDVHGGRITVNGRHEPDWVTPHILSLPPGTYRIDVSKGGYSRWSQLVDVGEGTRRWVMANLGLPSGLFVLQTDPPGMEVFIDGRYYGPSMVKTTLAAGEHTYKVVSPSGGEPFFGTVEIEAGRILMKKVRWQEASELRKGDGDSANGRNETFAARRKAS